jgi:hypothetical protein
MVTSDIAGIRLKMYNICLPRICLSHANCIRVIEPRTGSGGILASQIKYGHSALLRLAYRLASEKLLNPANRLSFLYC